ncbi:metallophosphoesterase [Hyalangium versicolor]|uniref:metallophosphoesterase n=1 Tax=Hyalangium versicolor TaxID=2861190 RepID=UPI001CCA643C|nr:metallophosphoesterase [Hyalangium versicolor]
MRTVILSDLHLGNGPEYEIFAGARELPEFLDTQSEPTRVVLNGDAVDFLMNDDPLVLDTQLAVEQAQALACWPSTADVFAALGRILARGGEVIIRLGNHDIELALAEVQTVFREALRQPPEIAARLAFMRGDSPLLLDVGGARLLMAHGDHTDNWNKVEYAHLPGPGAPTGAAAKDYQYAAGSVLVKTLLNPLKARYSMKFANLLAPDFQGAVLAALAVNPSAVKLLFQSTSLDILWQLFRKSRMPLNFDPGEPGPVDLGLASTLDGAGLSNVEREELEAALSDTAMSFDGDEGALSQARLKVARTVLGAYARVQRLIVGQSGERHFSLEPTNEETQEAQRLAEKFGAGAVISGHTHAARWKVDSSGVYANSGTWIWLMRLPSPDASDEIWADFLEELQRNPGLDPARQHLAKLEKRFTGILAEPDPKGGATVSLVQWEHPDDPPRTLRALASTHVPAA